MRTQTFISSMVGVVAAAALAGSANAAIVSGPNLYCDALTFNPYTATILTFNLLNANSGVTTTATWGTLGTFKFGMAITLLTTSYPNNSNVGSVQYSFDAGATYGSQYTLGQVNSSISSASYGGDVSTSSNASAKLRDFRIRVTLPTASNYALGTDANGTGGSNVQLRMIYDASNGVDGFGGAAVSTGTRAVPAPGAAALVGLAGLVATRRRRN